jgi:outer membrane lipoprotein-sorting protein
MHSSPFRYRECGGRVGAVNPMDSAKLGIVLVLLAMVPPIARADKTGEAWLQKCLDAETRAGSISAQFTHEFKENGQLRTQTGTIEIKKPNFAHIVVVAAKKETTGNVVINSDGKNFITYSQSDNDYALEAADVGGGNIARNNILETAIFFNPDMLNRLRSLASGVKVVSEVSVGNAPCKVLRFDGIQGITLKLYIGADGLIRGTLKKFNGDTDETHLVGLKSNADLAPVAFRWQPPRSAKTVQQVAASMAQQANSVPQQAISLLPVGRKAPDFTLPRCDGGSLTLSSVITSHKAILLNFWSYFCGPCRAGTATSQQDAVRIE